jgi:hypothetical protein
MLFRCSVSAGEEVAMTDGPRKITFAEIARATSASQGDRSRPGRRNDWLPLMGTDETEMKQAVK